PAPRRSPSSDGSSRSTSFVAVIEPLHSIKDPATVDPSGRLVVSRSHRATETPSDGCSRSLDVESFSADPRAYRADPAWSKRVAREVIELRRAGIGREGGDQR